MKKPFKLKMRKLWGEWMVNGEEETTKLGKRKRLGFVLVCEWIVKAWESILLVMRSFFKCSISNSMDGSDDDELFSEFLCGKESDASQHQLWTMSQRVMTVTTCMIQHFSLIKELCEQLLENDLDESFESFE